MASSVYYQNEVNYWNHHHHQANSYPSINQDYSNCYQQQQLQQQQHPSYAPTVPVVTAQPSSLLETLLRHGKEAINDTYSTSAAAAVVKLNSSAANQQAQQQQQQPSHVSCHTPPYTPTSSDRNSPSAMCVQEATTSYVPTPETYPAAPSNYHYQNPYQSAGGSPVKYDGVVQQPNNCLYDNNNKSPKKDYSLEDGSQLADFAWMKSSGSSGEYIYIIVIYIQNKI